MPTRERGHDQLGRTINPTLYTLDEWQTRRAAGNSFVLRVAEQDKIELIGDDPEGAEHV